MGRESLVAFIPTSSMSGGSCAPMENSPPGIQTIPTGACEGAGAEFGTVGRNMPTGSTLAAFVVDDGRLKLVSTIAMAAIERIPGTSHTGQRKPRDLLALVCWRGLFLIRFRDCRGRLADLKSCAHYQPLLCLFKTKTIIRLPIEIQTA